MASVQGEGAFESAIESHLLARGWVQGSASHYRRDLGLDTAVLFEFIGATQSKAWDRLVGLHGGAEQAQAKFAKRLAAEIDARGTIDVLRRGVEDMGVKIRMVFFKPAHALTPDLLALYDANRLVVSRQVHHSESNPKDSVDLLLLVNGLSVATAELKNQVTGQTVEHAKRQYRFDRNPKDLVFDRRTVVHFAVDQDLVFLTTRLEGEKTRFLPFNQGSGGPGQEGGKGNPPNPNGYRTAYLWEHVWQRDNWLDLLARFVHEEKPTGRGRTAVKRGKVIFPRYHQWDLVLRLADHASTDGPGRNYLPQHSAGSGKSNSIAWLAHRLSTLHTPADPSLLTEHATGLGLGPNEKVFHKVVVVTDRVILDRQLQDTIWQFDHTPGVVERIDKNSAQLAEALEGSRAQVIITTLQKFPVIAKAATDLKGKRFAVIVDEAHSSQSGESAKDLKAVLGADAHVAGSGGTVDEAIWDAAEKYDAALEESADPQDALTDSLVALRASAATRGMQDNLSFFAFTATPKAKTLELFGERVPDPAMASGYRLEPFHLYSMRQAIQEGFILDVLANYVTYSTYFRLANGLSSSDPEVDKGKANAALARFVALHPSNLAQKSEIIVEHFRTVTRKEIGGLAKAMVVTRSRLHAVRYKQSIEAYIKEKCYPDLHALVAFSGKVQDPDLPGKEYTEPSMNLDSAGKPIPESQTAKRFQGSPDDGFPVGDYQVLIVAEKYQTGFDEPLLHTMYVDKKLDGVKAVQTLSRLNRTTAPGKDGTFVLDFANKAEDIQEAFKPFYETSWTEPTDPNVLFTLKQRIMDAGVIDASEMRDMVAALLASEKDAHAALHAKTDPAVERYLAIPQLEDREDFRTALRDYVRTYSFLGQVVPFTRPDLEELFYYGKVLVSRLPKTVDEDGDVDISDSAVLTHIRTQMSGEHDLALNEGDGEGVPGISGDGSGVQTVKDKVRLSALIDLLNDRFGTAFTEIDQVLWLQQVAAAAADPELVEVAKGNTEENFGFVFDPKFGDVIIDRQAANDELFRMFFDKPEFREVLTAWARTQVYKTIQDGLAGTA
jgi:type I restriction enzyme R subunit